MVLAGVRFVWAFARLLVFSLIVMAAVGGVGYTSAAMYTRVTGVRLWQPQATPLPPNATPWERLPRRTRIEDLNWQRRIDEADDDAERARLSAEYERWQVERSL